MAQRGQCAISEGHPGTTEGALVAPEAAGGVRLDPSPPESCPALPASHVMCSAQTQDHKTSPVLAQLVPNQKKKTTFLYHFE